MSKLLLVILCILALPAAAFASEENRAEPGTALPVKVLLLPKFEVDEMSGDFPGEAQYYYEEYLTGAEVYDIPDVGGVSPLYYKDGVALYLPGMGKISAALGTMSVLSDSRFDFSDSYIISTGCAGSAVETTVMGDVFIITSAVDYDLGHHADSRDISDPEGPTWFHDDDFDETAVVSLDHDLMDKVYSLVKDVPLETTQKTRDYMKKAFDGADWAVRDPRVMRGTTVTGDNYWKGEYGHKNALLMVETYQCPDPYVLTEMEDIAIALAVKQMGLLDRMIIIRDSVNMDVFMPDVSPESLWSEAEAEQLTEENSTEAADIFATAMKNNFEVGRIVIDRILDGSF